MLGSPRPVVDEALQVGEHALRITALTVGNPHCVVPLAQIGQGLACELGPQLEWHPLFPRRTNVQFLQVLDRQRIRIEIWERGAGYTLASGSSSCAAAAAAVRLGLCSSPVQVEMPGGQLEVTVSPDYKLTLLGPVSQVAEGQVAKDLLQDLDAIG
jgi:diaminopimelate epimerase